MPGDSKYANLLSEETMRMAVGIVITGNGISSLIPIPSELNTTTIQNAILSLGSIKAKIYEPSTILSNTILVHSFVGKK